MVQSVHKVHVESPILMYRTSVCSLLNEVGKVSGTPICITYNMPVCDAMYLFCNFCLGHSFHCKSRGHSLTVCKLSQSTQGTRLTSQAFYNYTNLTVADVLCRVQ